MNFRAKPDEPRPWPFQPWFSYVARRANLIAHRRIKCPGCACVAAQEAHRTCMSLATAAERYGLTERTLQRWEKIGLTDRQADHLAVLSGVHPANIWPGWYEMALTPLDDLHVHGSDTAEPGWRTAALYEAGAA